MKMKRDQALACLIMAVCITLATFLCSFGEKDRLAIEGAQQSVDLHERLLRLSAATFQQNQDALNGVSVALENLEKNHKQ